MDDTKDLLQAKIEKAKEGLPPETLRAIETVDWKATILGMHEKKGYSFEQLGDLETETELVLCGLLSPADYPKELERRMNIPRTQAESLTSEMNELVFKKIREELIKNTSQENTIRPAPAPTAMPPKPKTLSEDITNIKRESLENSAVLKQAGIEIMPSELASGKTEKGPDPLHISKLSAPFKMPQVKTEYTVSNMSKGSVDVSKINPLSTQAVHEKPITPIVPLPSKGDPYRMPIE